MTGNIIISKARNNSNKDGLINFSKFSKGMNGLMIDFNNYGKCIVFSTINFKQLIHKMTGTNLNLIMNNFSKSTKKIDLDSNKCNIK